MSTAWSGVATVALAHGRAGRNDACDPAPIVRRVNSPAIVILAEQTRHSCNVHSWAIASKTLRRDARRAGNDAATNPAIVARTT